MDRSRAFSGSPYEEGYGFCRAMRVGDRVEIAGTAPIPRPGEELAPTARGQMQRCLEIAIQALEGLDGDVSHVTRTRMFIADPADADEIGEVHAKVFGASPPVATMVVTRLLNPDWKVEIEVEAIVGA